MAWPKNIRFRYPLLNVLNTEKTGLISRETSVTRRGRHHYSVLKQKDKQMSGRFPGQSGPTVGVSTNGNFSSIYNVLLHEKDEVVFAVHMLFKYLTVEEIADFLHNSGCGHIKHTPDGGVPLVDYVCKAMRFLNMTGRTKYMLTKLEAECERKGRKNEYSTDYFSEMMQWEGMEHCC